MELSAVPPDPAPESPALEREREALRVQAAAVVAQQAALTELEGRLEQRRLALERQEEQLAAHLESKRARLLEQQQRVRDARLALQRERTEHAERTAAETEALERLRHEVSVAQGQNQQERQRLTLLHQRLRQRYEKQAEAERAAVRRWEDELAGRRHDLDRETERLAQDRARLTQDRLRWNAEVELGRRQLQAGWDALHEQQHQAQEEQARRQAELQERAHDLDQRAGALAERERELTDQWQQWEEVRASLQREIEGLENRARNVRRKLAEQEQERPAPEAAAEPPAVPTPSLRRAPVPVPEEGLAELERLAGELADQRLHLAEECERLVLARQGWDREQQGMLEELEAAGVRLQEREFEVLLREDALAPREFALARREEDVARLRHRLDADLARVAARAATWEGEHRRLLEQVRAREALVERRWLVLVEVRRRWAQRRRQELKQLRADLGRCRDVRREYAALWEECFRRRAELDRKEHELAEQSLALEQYQLERLGQAEDPAAEAKRLERQRRRCAATFAGARRHLHDERRLLKAQGARFVGQLRQLERRLDEATAREGDLGRRLTAWEHEQLLAEDGDARLRRELQSLQAQCGLYEHQLGQMRDEVERVARSLIDDPEPPALPIAQAA